MGRSNPLHRPAPIWPFPARLPPGGPAPEPRPLRAPAAPRPALPDTPALL
jgi:hypothetical protein